LLTFGKGEGGENVIKTVKPRGYVCLIAFLVAGLTIASVAGSIHPVAAQVADGPWPMFRGGPDRTGVAPEGSGTFPSVLADKWTADLGGPVVSSPSIVNSKIYIGSYDHNIYCLDAESGSVIWKYKTKWRVRNSPAVVGGKVYVGPDDGSVYCLDANTGSLIWQNTLHTEILKTVLQPIAQIRSSPAVVGGKVYVGSLNDRVYCLDAETGSTIWKYKTGDRVASSPAIANGMVYIGSTDHNVYALDQETGGLIWEKDLFILDNPHPSSSRSEVDATPCIPPPYDTLYVFSNTGWYVALDTMTGEVKWKYFINLYRGVTGVTQAVPAGSFAGVVNGKVYFVDEYYATAADANTGTILWEESLGYPAYSSVTYADGKIYAGSDLPGLFVIDAETGEKLSQYKPGSNLHSSVTPAYDKIYVGCADWRLYCFEQKPETKFPTALDMQIWPEDDLIQLNWEGADEVNFTGTIVWDPFRQPEIPPELNITFTKPDNKTRPWVVRSEANGTFCLGPVEVDYFGNWTVDVTWEGDDWNDPGAYTFGFEVLPAPEPAEQQYFAVVVAVVAVVVIVGYWYWNKNR
jgi:outer membrane protein assembly factor BamB